MKKVFQDDVTNKTGTCLPACVATLFDIDFELAKRELKIKQNWAYEYHEFIKKHTGKFVITIPIIPNSWFHPELKASEDFAIQEFFACNPYIKNQKVILAVDTLQTSQNHLHAVVAEIYNKELVLLHDPNTNNENKTIGDYTVKGIDLFVDKIR